MSDIVTERSEENKEIHTSALLRDIIAKAPSDHFTLEWLINGMPENSFGVIILFLALIALLPVISVVAKLLIAFFALQIMAGFPAPVLPQKILLRKLPSRYLAHLNRHAIPALQKLEKVSRPRWSVFLTTIRPIAAAIGFFLTLLSLLVPLPVVDIMPTAIIVMITLAYIESDGLLLLLGLICGLIILTFVAFAML